MKIFLFKNNDTGIEIRTTIKVFCPKGPKIEIVLFLEKEKDRLLIIGLSGSKPKLKFSRTILLIFLPSARII